MRPPICAICHKRFRAAGTAGGRITFLLTEEEAERKKRMIERRMKGHPPGLEWFCEDHIELARKYKHLTKAEAKQEIKKELAEEN